jgi:hypothetical protein
MIRQGLYILLLQHDILLLLFSPFAPMEASRAPTQEHSAVAGPPYLEELHISTPHTTVTDLEACPKRKPEPTSLSSFLSGAVSFSYVCIRVLTKSLAMYFGAAARDRSIRQWDSYRHATSWAYPSPLPYCRCHDTIDRLQMMNKYRMPIYFTPS